jgi:anti-anti-sigma regulatory factor
MKNGDGILKLANVSDKVAGLLAITNLDKVFEYYPSVDEALASD